MFQWNKKNEVRHFDKLTERLRRADAAVESEYDENDRRLNWTLVFHAFLFQAYATCLQILDNDITQTPPIVNNLFIWAIIAIICSVGFFTAIITWTATNAAIQAICIEKDKREKIEKEAEEYGFESHGFPTWEKLHRDGLLPARFFPGILCLAWLSIILISFFNY